MSAIIHNHKNAQNAQVEAWLETNQAKLQGYSRSLAGKFTTPTLDADDIFQAMCFKIWYMANRVPEFLARGDAYLFKTAWNEGLQMLRSERRYSLHIEIPAEARDEEPETEFELPDTSSLPEALVLTGTDNELLAEAIHSLPAKTQTICKLLYAGRKPAEIAQELGVSRSHVSQTVGRIQEKFIQAGLSPA